jgi:hypothetical protein
MTAKKVKVVAAVAHLDSKARKLTKAQKLRQHRQIAAWQREAQRRG